MRLVLGILICFSFVGALFHLEESLLFLVIPAFGVICWKLSDDVVKQNAKIQRLESQLKNCGAQNPQFSQHSVVAPKSVHPDRPSAPPLSEEACLHAVAPLSALDVLSAANGDGSSPTARPSSDAQFEFGCAPAEAPPCVAPPKPWRRPPATEESTSLENALAWVKNWITGGNPVAKVGIVVLFFGVSFLLKYAADHSLLPPELRLAGAGLLGIILLGMGWQLRQAKPGFALLVQGGGVGVLYLTIFSATRFLHILSPVWALTLMTCAVVFSGMLAVLQNASALAVFGAAGGFLAPVLLSTGQGSHVHLFAYYALLNLGIAGIAWRKSWRALNLLGFFFTFGIGAAWGAKYYAPEHFNTTEPFLLLFFLTYSAISILAARSAEQAPSVRMDSALVFGLPLLAFGLQMALVREMDMGGAFSALGLAMWYLVTVRPIRRFPYLQILGEAHLALGVMFLTVAVPLALDASWTASTWPLEGAGMVWLGLRQRRVITRVFGLLLQLGGLLAFALSLSFGVRVAEVSFLLPGLFLAVGGFFSGWAYWSLAEAREEWEKDFSSVLGIWAAVLWHGIWYVWIFKRLAEYEFVAALALTMASLCAWCVVFRFSRWPLVRYFIPATLPLVLVFALLWPEHPGTTWGGLVWPLTVATLYGVLFRFEEEWDAVLVGWLHSLMLLVLAVLLGREVEWLVFGFVDSTVWSRAGAALAVLALLVGTAVSPSPRWPLQCHGAAYSQGGAALAAFLGLWWLAACRKSGNPQPLPYIPGLSPLDLAQAMVGVGVAIWARRAVAMDILDLRRFQAYLPGVLGGTAFVWLNVVLARTFHAFAEVPYALVPLFRSVGFQAACSMLWSLTALWCMLLGWQRGQRRPWQVGAGLLGVVVLKLFLVDLAGHGSVARIVSFLGVGALMLAVGYFCPIPPKGERP